MKQMNLLEELIVDNFAGGGGASTGIELATGRPVDIAINHDPDAIAMHKANHPYTTHYCESVWDVDPKKVCRGRKVGLAWFSPDCKHFSKAKGGKPVDKNIRGLAWIVLKDMGTCKKRKTSQKQSGRNILEMERAAGKPWVLHRAQGTGSGRLWSAYYTKAFLSDCTM